MLCVCTTCIRTWRGEQNELVGKLCSEKRRKKIARKSCGSMHMRLSCMVCVVGLRFGDSPEICSRRKLCEKLRAFLGNVNRTRCVCCGVARTYVVPEVVVQEENALSVPPMFCVRNNATQRTHARKAMVAYAINRCPDEKVRHTASKVGSYCQVCFERLDSAIHGEATPLPCEHRFHDRCIEEIARNAPYVDSGKVEMIDCPICAEAVPVSSLGGDEYNRKAGLPRVTSRKAPEDGCWSPLESLVKYALREGPMSVVMCLDHDANRRGHPPFVGGPAWGRAVHRFRTNRDPHGETMNVTRIGNGPMEWARFFMESQMWYGYEGEYVGR